MAALAEPLGSDLVSFFFGGCVDKIQILRLLFFEKEESKFDLLNLHVRPKGPSKRCSRPAHGLDVLVLVIAFVFFVKPINRAPT